MSAQGPIDDAGAALPGEPTLLLADDDDAFREAMSRALARRGFAVTASRNVDEAEAEAEKQVFEYALVDVRMPGRSGIDLVAALRRIDEGTRVVVLTGSPTRSRPCARARRIT